MQSISIVFLAPKNTKSAGQNIHERQLLIVKLVHEDRVTTLYCD